MCSRKLSCGRSFCMAGHHRLGATSPARGLGASIYEKIGSFIPACSRVHVVAPPERKISSWIGGSILSSLKGFESRWVSAAEYGELGARVLDRMHTSWTE